MLRQQLNTEVKETDQELRTHWPMYSDKQLKPFEQLICCRLGGNNHTRTSRKITKMVYRQHFV